MKFDDILGEIGEFGKYQRWVYAMVCIIALPVASHQMAQVFLAGASDHWCDVAAWSEEDCSKWDYNEAQCTEAKRNASSPINATEDESQCYKYSLVDELFFHPGLDPVNYNDTTTIKCNDGWVYDRSQYKSSLIQEFNLVCDDANLDSLAQSLFFLGVLIGSLFFGTLADSFGRRKTLFIALALQIAAGIGVAFAPSYWWFASLRVIVGIANMGVFLLCFVIGTEMVGPNRRTVAGMSIQIAFSGGYIILSLFAYFIRDWFTLQLVITLPALLFFGFYPFLPESPRWLICKGRTEEATKIIQKAADTNKKQLPDPIFSPEELKEQQEALNAKQATVIVLFRTPNLRIRTINCMFNWFVNTMVYYGLSLSTSDLGSNDYIAFFISGAVEIPAVITGIFAIDYFGRKWSTFGYMIFGGVACLCTIFTPPGPWATTIAMLGKFGITASFAIIYVFSAELFPTPVRSAGVGLCSMCARVAGILSPYVLLLSDYWEPLPVLIFGILSITAGILILFLPETLGAQLPQTIEEGELFGTKKGKDLDLEDQKGETYTLHTISSSMDEKNKEDNGHVTQEDNGHVNQAFEDNNI
ncbi:organic cation transporter protein [Strongylocentrotus purpuratus]|uniref:Major facilitator superfamily (MFS) profile domain-containing protein n=1 Tax=Strongylocentrotus purpuratus TaxID=7668 RepID=A0A7M7PE99_STRPU|nr:organic cation transporter protein [Strongylocentrotus purpuratus]